MEDNKKQRQAVHELFATMHEHREEESICEHCKHTTPARYWVVFKLDAITGKSEAYNALSSVINNGNGVDDESAYAWTFDYLGHLLELLDNDESLTLEQIQDSDDVSEYADRETDIYNHDLLQWLAKGNNFMFVEDMTNEYGQPLPNNWLAVTQCYARHQHYSNLLQVVREYADGKGAE